MKKACILIAALMISLLLMAACSQGKAPAAGGVVTLRIGMMSSSDVIPYVLINERGLAEKAGLDLRLETFTSAKDRDAALTAGELDGVLTDYIGICTYQNAGFDVKITGITDGDYILIAGKETGITEIGQTEGRSIAISENTLIDYSLDYILEQSGLSGTALNRELVPRIPDRLELLRKGKIDLGLMPEPFATLAINDGCAVLGSANQYGLYPAVSAFTKAALDEKGEAIRKLYQAYDEAVEYMNRTSVRDYEELVIQAVGYPAEMSGKIEIKPFRKSTLPPREDIERAVRWASAKGLCGPELTYEQMTFDVGKQP